MNPQRFELMGVQDKEFLVRRGKAETRDILAKSGYKMSDEEYDKLFDAAVSLFNDGEKYVSLDSVLYLKGLEIEKKVEKKLRG